MPYNIFNIVTSLGINSLWANNLAFGTLAPGLPDNQWHIEVLGWLQTILVQLQASVVNYASNNHDKLGPQGKVNSPYNAS